MNQSSENVVADVIDATPTIQVEKAPIAIDQLANEFAVYDIPAPLKRKLKEKNITLSVAKIMMFSEINPITPAVVDYYSSLPLGRAEGEDFTSFKNRQKFQRAILRNRNSFTIYPDRSTKQIKRAERKMKAFNEKMENAA